MREVKFKIGDTIYVSKFGRRGIKIECPVCFGKKNITLILGNDDSVIMPCEFCKDGLGTPAKGYVTENRMDAGASAAVISKVSIEQTADGCKVEYQSGSYRYYSKDVFATEDEALAESKLRADKYNLEHETKAEFIKGKPDKNYSWNAGYHLRLVKNAERDIEYHSKMAKICKHRAKAEK